MSKRIFVDRNEQEVLAVNKCEFIFGDLSKLEQEDFDIVLLFNMDSVELLERFRNNNPYAIIIYINEVFDPELFKRVNIDSYIPSSVTKEEITTIIEGAATRSDQLLNSRTPSHEELRDNVKVLLDNMNKLFDEEPPFLEKVGGFLMEKYSSIKTKLSILLASLKKILL